MRLSSGSAVDFAVVVTARAQDRVQDVDAPAGEREDRLVVGLAFGPFAGVVGLAGWIAAGPDECRLVEGSLEGFVPGSGALQVADLAGLLEHRRQPGGRGEGVAAGNRVMPPVTDRNSAVRVAPIPGRLRMRGASGWRPSTA